MDMRRSVLREKADGFSLVEVNLAVMLVALGLLVLFSLFPAGLSQGERAHTDTQAALFASFVMDTIRANASGMTWAQWGGNENAFRTDVLNNTLGVVHTGKNAIAGAITFPPGSGNHVKYMLAVDPVPNSLLWGASLWVWGSKYGPTDPKLFRNRAKWFYTELFYSGMP